MTVTLEGTVNYCVKYNEAKRAIAEARSVDEVKDIIDFAARMKLYAQQANDKQILADADEIRRRATRLLGELMAAQYETVGKAKPPGDNQYGRAEDRVIQKPEAPPTLAEAGIDKNLAHQARTIAALPEEQFENVVTENRERILDEVRRADRRVINISDRKATSKSPVVVPPGRYGCIVVDPPWPMEKIERDVRPNQTGFEYATMTEEELAAFDPLSLAADDCHLFCWTTQKFLPTALWLVDTWGFRYVCTFVWHKLGGFQAVGLPQYNCEFVVYARRGSPKFVDTKDFFTCFTAPRREA